MNAPGGSRVNVPSGSRVMLGAAPNQRKSRVESKMSFIPKPKFGRANSFDRLSEVGAKRMGRPQSVEHGRATLSIAGRQSRDVASASKNQFHRRSKSTDVFTTPRVGRSMFPRNTTTPSRTPSGDRGGRSWQKSLERALAYVVVKDKRPITKPEWQKREMARVSQILAERFECETSPLVRPLTISRFVDIVSKLLSLLLTISDKHQINSVNYVTNLPRFTKRVLYPGPISKSWLKTVNTLHTFPNALALISYLVDLVCRYEAPCSEEWIYANNDEASKLKREYIYDKAWKLFSANEDVTPIKEEYAYHLKQLLGIDPERLETFRAEIEEFKEKLADPAEIAAVEDERRIHERINLLGVTLKETNTECIQIKADVAQKEREANDLASSTETLEKDIFRIRSELEELKSRVEDQSMSAQERKELLQRISFSNEVLASKQHLIEEVTNMVAERDKELSRRQKEAMEACVAYNQRIIKLSRHYDCKQLQVEERELVCESTLERVHNATASFRQLKAELEQKLQLQQRQVEVSSRRLSQQNSTLNQLQTRREELSKAFATARESLRTAREEVKQQTTAVHTQARALAERARHARLAAEHTHKTVKAELQNGVRNDEGWEKNLSELRQKVLDHEEAVAKMMVKAKEKRLKEAYAVVASWREQLNPKK